MLGNLEFLVRRVQNWLIGLTLKPLDPWGPSVGQFVVAYDTWRHQWYVAVVQDVDKHAVELLLVELDGAVRPRWIACSKLKQFWVRMPIIMNLGLYGAALVRKPSTSESLSIYEAAQACLSAAHLLGLLAGISAEAANEIAVFGGDDRRVIEWLISCRPVSAIGVHSTISNAIGQMEWEDNFHDPEAIRGLLAAHIEQAKVTA